jgi:tetratricopeptide (TPR) repeat protein
MLFLFVAADGCSSDPNVEGAKLDLRNKQYDRALENLETALATNPDNAEALELKGRVLAEKAFETPDVDEHTQLIEQMLDAYNRAENIDPTMSEAVLNAKRLAYQSEFQRGVQAFNRGRNEQSEYLTSAKYFDAASTIMPDSAGAYVNQAFALMNGGDMNAAMEPFEMAIEKGDREEDTYIFLASIYENNDRASDAVTLLEDASKQYPMSEDIQTELLNAYQLAGETDRALEMYATAVRNNPENKLFRYNYGSLLVQTEQFEAAAEQLRKAIEIDPEYGNAYYNLGASYINQAVKLNEHIVQMDDSLRTNRDNMNAQAIEEYDARIMRHATERTDMFRAAIEPLEKAKELFESSGEDATDVCIALFQAYVQTNQTDKAEGVQSCAGFEDSSGQ